MKSVHWFLLILLGLYCQIYAGTDYFVSPSGNNGNDGSLGSPWQTITYALTQITAGDTIKLREGTYFESVFLWKLGNSANRITIKNYNFETAVIDGQNRLQNLFFNNDTTAPGYFTIQGLELKNATGAAIHMMRDARCHVLDCIIHDNDIGLLIEFGRGNTIEGNTIYNNYRSVYLFASDSCIVSNNVIYNGAGGIICDENSSANFLVNNTIHDCQVFGPYNTSGIQVGRFTVVYRNRIYNNDGTAIFIDAGDHNHVIRNEIFQNGGHGIRVRGEPTVLNRGNHNIITNNTVVENSGDGIRCEGSTSQSLGKGVKIFNNISMDNGGSELSISQWFTTELYLDYNNWYSASGGTLINYGSISYMTVESFSDTTLGHGHSQNGLSVDPQYLDQANGDFHLLETSPAIDQGLDTLGQLIGWGLDFTGDSLDLGALEYNMESYLELDLTSLALGKSLPTQRTSIPLTSPFPEDPRSVNLIPANAIDWVLIQLLHNQTRIPIHSRSAFLTHAGHIVTEDGVTQPLRFDLVEEDDFILQLRQASNDLLVEADQLVNLGFSKTTRFNFTPDNSNYVFTDVAFNHSAIDPGQLLAVYPNHPNPFNNKTIIHYRLHKYITVKISIYNTQGQILRTLLKGQQPPGPQFIPWDGKDAIGRALPSGVYLYRIEAGTEIQTKKMMLVK